MAIEVTVTDEQNRDWHRSNVKECEEWVEEVKRQNAKRLADAELELEQARAWAHDEGVEI